MMCFLTVTRVTTRSSAICWLGAPAASRRSTCVSRAVSGSVRPGILVRPLRPVWGAPLAGAQDSCEVAEGYLPGGGLPVPVRAGYLAEQGRHRRAFVGEHPDIALRGGQGKRPGKFFCGGGLVTGGRERQRPQRPDLDDAA